MKHRDAVAVRAVRDPEELDHVAVRVRVVVLARAEPVDQAAEDPVVAVDHAVVRGQVAVVQGLAVAGDRAAGDRAAVGREVDDQVVDVLLRGHVVEADRPVEIAVAAVGVAAVPVDASGHPTCGCPRYMIGDYSWSDRHAAVVASPVELLSRGAIDTR